MLATLAFVDIASFLDRITRHKSQAVFAAAAAVVVLGIRIGKYAVVRTRPQHEEGTLYIVTSFVAAFFVGWFAWGFVNLWIENPEPLLYAPIDLDVWHLFFGSFWRPFLLVFPIGAAAGVAAFIRGRNKEMHEGGSKKRQTVQMLFWMFIVVYFTILVIHLLPGFIVALLDKGGETINPGSGYNGDIPPVTVPPRLIPPGTLPSTK